MTEARNRAAWAIVAACALAAMPRTADAFCGFYVAGSGDKLFNDATQVVMMRQGTRTVLAMQNNYRGPPDAFAMVIPVPVVLKEADVKTLANEVFDRVDQMGAPRLVEYWEQDPCATNDDPADEWVPAEVKSGAKVAKPDGASLGVKIEAQFTVGEYQIVILSAKHSTGLQTWLVQESYRIPAGAEPLLRPYVEAGMKFFVAKVDPTKVKFEDGRAALSPLRFHYDSDEFSLPIRLGLANSSGKQDLIVHILAPRQRYEVSNYPNVRIPTNIDVRASVKGKFAEFYTALFDRTALKHPRAVITEYAWDATTCDPCPGPALDSGDFATLGADVLEGSREQPVAYRNRDFVLTRLHARYGKELADDLRFKAAPPIAGGREHMGATGKLEEGSEPSSVNNFQGRYAIRHPWMGPITCEKPVRNRWGEEPGRPPGRSKQTGEAATNLAFVKRDAVQLPKVIARDVPELDLEMAGAPAAPGSSVKSGCCQGTPSDSGGLLLTLGAGLWIRSRRRPAPQRTR